MRRACSHSCSSVLASLAQLATSVVSITSPNRLCTSARAAVEAAVEEGRADQRLERVGEDRRAQRAAAARLAFAEAQRLGQAELERDAVQAVLAHEVGAHAGQVALVGVAEALEQQARDDQAQDRVAEELEALVVVGAEAAVGQRAFQQGRVAEPVADALLQCYETGIHAMKGRPVAKRAEDY